MESTSHTEFSPAMSAVLSGLRKLKTGSLLIVVAVIILGGSLLALLGSIFTFNVDVVVATLLSWMLLSLIALVLTLVAVYAYLVPSAWSLAKWKPEEFSVISNLLVTGYIGGLVSTLLALVLLIADVTGITGGSVVVLLLIIVLAIAGVILLFIGWIGNVVYFLKLRDAFNSSTFLVAGILLVLSPLIPLLSIITWILTYIEASSLEKKLISGLMKI